MTQARDRTRVIYLHGLDSSARSHKATVLRERLAPIPVEVPDYPAHRPPAAIELLSRQWVKWCEGTPPILVGSSLGGFYGEYLARRFPVRHLFLINPALAPWTLLQRYVGSQRVTAGGEHYVLTAELIDSTRAYAVTDPCDGVPTTVLVDEGDEVIDPRHAIERYRHCGRVQVFPGGDHRFRHLDEAITLIRAIDQE